MSKSQKIDLVAISSEPHRNFFLLAMDGIVYKYDLVTKELLFQFKSPCSVAMYLYDEDDKLVTADNREVRLWDFFEHKEEAPQLLTTMQASFVIEKVYTNNVCKQNKKGAHYVLLTSGNQFELYTDRLNLKDKRRLEEAGATFQSAEFHPSNKLILGTSNGKLLVYDLELNKFDGEPIRIGGVEQNITKIKAFVYIEDQPIFLVIIENKELYIFNEKMKTCRQIDFGEDGREYLGERISNLQISYNSKFFAVGVPDKRVFGVFKIDRDSLRVTPPTKWVDKVSIFS